jgi:hypothetical protein
MLLKDNFRYRVVQYFLEICGLIMQICGFAICRLTHLRNSQICDSGMSRRICGFRTYKKSLLAHLWKDLFLFINEPKN